VIPSPKDLPDRPGVYLMKDGEGEVIYVGKALSLKKRVRSYFTRPSKGDLRPASRHLRDQVKEVDFITTRNETEAFLLENNLIKKLKPRFNIRLKDDKTFLSLKVDRSHPFPAVVPVRRPRRDGSLYFGPYASARALRSTLKVLRSVVPLRDCSDREFRNRRRPCIKHEIGRCPAPCVGRIDEAAYNTNLERALCILRGDTGALLQQLEREMAEASKNMAFEKAGRLRDQIAHLKSFARSQRVESVRFWDVDVIGIHHGEGLTCVVVLFFRDGKLLSSRAYTFELAVEEEELLSQFLLRFYDGKRYVPEEIYLPLKIPEMQAMETYLRGQRKAAFKLKTALRGEGVKLIAMARENARLSLRASKKAQENAAQIQESLAKIFRLKHAPVSIEGVDLSTTGGGEAVGVVVHFRNGGPLRSRYRRYKIKTVEGMDDYAMLREVVSRRLRRGKAEKSLPDLILVDGGKGQLNSALAAARELEVDTVDFLSIAKGDTRAKAVHLKAGEDDRIIAPGTGDSPVLPSGSRELHLLQRIRDEAHRFAITYHRNRRQKKGMSSPLDRVRGLGRERKQRLLRSFGGLRELKGASPEEIGRVQGVGPVLADRIYRALRSS
jgi:excinuclease ABC subunit C